MNIISPNPHTLTQKTLKSLTPAQVLYLEFSETGAIGCPGTARLYTVEDGTINCYLVDTTATQSESTLKVYAAVYDLLKALENDPRFTYIDALYGNHVVKQTKSKFTRDDTNCRFIYKIKSKSYYIAPSCSGVYSMTARAIAPLAAIAEKHRAKLEAIHKTAEGDDLFLYQAYIEALETLDDNFGVLRFTIDEYQDALNISSYANHESFNFSDDRLRVGIRAIAKYRLRYLASRLGWTDLHYFFDKFLKSPATNLYELLIDLLEEPIINLFDQIARIDISTTNLDDTSDDSFASFFFYPIFANLPEDDRHSIHRQILEMTPDALRQNARSIAYYFTNYIWHEDIWPLTDVLPAAVHVVENLPMDDENSTETAACFAIAGEIINSAWRYLSEDKDKQKKFRDLVYQAYWPRIGSTWPLRHYGEFEFKDPATTKIFEDALGFVMSLEDLTTRNREIKAFFSEFAPNHPSPSYHVEHRVFTESLKNLSSKEQFNKILAWREPSDYYFYLTYPETTEDAKRVLDELIKPEGKITGYTRFSVMEKLLLNPHSLGVGEYILNYLVKHFNQFIKAAEADAEITTENYAPVEILSTYFTALYAGISEENEFPPAKALLEKLVQIGADRTQLEAAITAARKHRRTIAFQRAALQKLF